MTKNEKRNTIYWFLDLLTDITGVKHDFRSDGELWWELVINDEIASPTMDMKRFMNFVNDLWIYQQHLKKVLN